MNGFVHSIQTLGASDGPGVRFVVFMKGCNLRCGCCHNPDTWDIEGGTAYDATALADRATRYREYFGKEGGVTVSGGEPLLQADFVREFFAACHARGLNTCLDTSGSIIDEKTAPLLAETDRVLLDIKYTTDEMYRKHVGCSIETPLAFLRLLEENKIATTLRQVIIPVLNDTDENIKALADIMKNHTCIDKVELLPFKKICAVKYKKMGIPFPFDTYDTPRPEAMKALNEKLETFLS